MQSHRIHDLELSIQTPLKNELLMEFWEQSKELISEEHKKLAKQSKFSTLLHDSVRSHISNEIIQNLNPSQLDIYMDHIIAGRDEDVFDGSFDNMIKAGQYTYARVDQEKVLANKLLSHFYCGSFSVSSLNQIGKPIHGSVKCSLFFCEKCQNHASKEIIQETGMGQGKFATIVNKTETNWDTLYRTLRRNEMPYISLPMGQDVYMVITNRANQNLFERYEFYGFKLDRDEIIIGDKAQPTDKIGKFESRITYPADKLHHLREHGHAKKQNGVLTGTLLDQSDLEELQKLSSSEKEEKADDKEDEGSYTGVIPYVMHNMERDDFDDMAYRAVKLFAKHVRTPKELYTLIAKMSEEVVFLAGKEKDQFYQEAGYKMMRFTRKDVDIFNNEHGLSIDSDDQKVLLEMMGMEVT